MTSAPLQTVTSPGTSPTRSAVKAGAAAAALVCFGIATIPATIRTVMYSFEVIWLVLVFIVALPLTGLAALGGALAGRLAAKTDKPAVGMLIGAGVFVPIALGFILLLVCFTDPSEAPLLILFHCAVIGGLSGGVATVFARWRRMPHGVPRRKPLQLTLGAMMSVTATLAVFFAEGRCLLVDKRPTFAQVERQVRDELKIGSSRAEVQTWIERNQLTTWTFAGASPASAGKQTFIEQAGLADNQVAESVRATVPNANTESIWAGAIDIWFYFDRDGILIGYAFNRWLNAL